MSKKSILGKVKTRGLPRRAERERWAEFTPQPSEPGPGTGDNPEAGRGSTEARVSEECANA